MLLIGSFSQCLFVSLFLLPDFGISLLIDRQSHLLGAFHHKIKGGQGFVFGFAVKYGVFECTLQRTNFAARGQGEQSHDFVACNGRLEIAYAVFLFDVDELLAHDFEVLQKVLFALLILAGDVGFAQQHEVLNVVASLK